MPGDDSSPGDPVVSTDFRRESLSLWCHTAMCPWAHE